MTTPPATSWIRGLAPVALVAVLLAATALLNQLAPATMQPTWNTCRFLAYPIGILSVIAVVCRLILMGVDVARWTDARALHLMGWFTWIVGVQFIAALGARYYDASDTPATWLSGARLATHLIAIALCVWWPHPEQYVPLEERS